MVARGLEAIKLSVFLYFLFTFWAIIIYACYTLLRTPIPEA